MKMKRKEFLNRDRIRIREFLSGLLVMMMMMKRRTCHTCSESSPPGGLASATVI